MSPLVQHLNLPEQRIAYVDISPEQPGTQPPHAGQPDTEERAGTMPLVMLHGGATDHRLWTPQLRSFPQRRVIAADARGHGGSSDADAPYRLTDDVIALLDALDIERAILLGLSMGGGTAVDTALEHPNRVAGLIVSGTGTSEPTFTDPWCLAAFSRWQEAELRDDLEGWIDAFMMFTSGPSRNKHDIDPTVWATVETMARDTIRQHRRLDIDHRPVPVVRPTGITNTWSRLPTITTPVLAICGQDDGPDHLRMTRHLADQVQQGTHVTTPGAHYPNLEDPHSFNAAIHTFLDHHHL